MFKVGIIAHRRDTKDIEKISINAFKEINIKISHFKSNGIFNSFHVTSVLISTLNQDQSSRANT